jgi:hypothetical protein
MQTRRLRKDSASTTIAVFDDRETLPMSDHRRRAVLQSEKAEDEFPLF